MKSKLLKPRNSAQPQSEGCCSWRAVASIEHFPLKTWLCIMLWAILVCILWRVIPEGTPHKHQLTQSKRILETLGIGLFMVLSIRTNGSYNRWWEGRVKWGAIVNRTRDLACQARIYVPDGPVQQCLIRHTVAFAFATKRHLRLERGLPEFYRESSLAVPEEVRLSNAELQALDEAQHVPLYALNVMRSCINQALKAKYITDIIGLQMDGNITNMQDSLGAAERILKTPFPYGYVFHLRAFAFLWLMAMPLTLVEEYEWGTIVMVGLAAFAFLGLEHLAVELENPFGHDVNDLPLDAICGTITSNLAEVSRFHFEHERLGAYAPAAVEITGKDGYSTTSSEEHDAGSRCL